MLDADLAALYGVSTKRLLEQVRRNPGRFPPDYCFQLSAEEFSALRSQIATSNPGRGGRRYRPWVFAEHGALMAATVLNSERAVAMSHYIIRAFVRLREEMLSRGNLEKRLNEIERTLIGHDAALRDLYERIKPLLLPPPGKTKREMGFHVKDQLTAAETKLTEELAADGLSIQENFQPEPRYKQSGKGHYAGHTVEEIRKAKASKRKKERA